MIFNFFKSFFGKIHSMLEMKVLELYQSRIIYFLIIMSKGGSKPKTISFKVAREPIIKLIQNELQTKYVTPTVFSSTNTFKVL